MLVGILTYAGPECVACSGFAERGKEGTRMGTTNSSSERGHLEADLRYVQSQGWIWQVTAGSIDRQPSWDLGCESLVNNDGGEPRA